MIRRKLSPLPGIHALEFNLMRRTLKVRHDPSVLPALSAALESLNLGAALMDGAKGSDAVIQAPKTPWRRLLLAGLFAAASEAVELALAWSGQAALAPSPADALAVATTAPLAAQIAAGGWIALLSPVLAVIAVFIGGVDTYRKGWLAIKNLNLNINALMSVAVTGALIIGQFPEAAMVMVLFNLAEAMEAKSLDRARNAVRKLLDLAPERATVQRADGSWAQEDIRNIEAGRLVRVKPGERVGLDGIIVQGQSALNQAPITGEGLPVDKGAGDAVFAGSINESGSFVFRVGACYSDSTLARIIRAVEEAQGSRAPMQRLVDKFAAYYTPAIFLAALAAGIIPPLVGGGDWKASAYTALTLLVIGCPCALVISTPVSIVSGLAAAARHGILVKGGLFLERGRLLKRLALDKTGTLTHGRPRQTDFINLGAPGGEEAFALAAALAARSDHPVSRAIAEAAVEKGLTPPEADEFAALPGRGVKGTIGGEEWRLGNRRLLEDLDKCPPELEELIAGLEKQGKSVVALVGNEGALALFAVADTLRESGIEAVRELKKLGVRTILLTGDNEYAAQAAAAQAGVDEFKSNLLPGDKLKIVEQLGEKDTVGMVGDGINDAPALARAHIGFAMAAAGTDTAIETADVALMDDDLRKIPRFIRLSRATYAILAQNVALALGVKAVFFILALAGQASMWMAVFADVGASVLVTANGLRAMRK
jgi:Cd2+/Zn2+-exporting ATPase